MSKERTNEMQETDNTKKGYAAPQILWTEELTARASTCAQGDSSCAPGPIQS